MMSTASTNLIPGPAGSSAPCGGAASRITLPEQAVNEFAATSPSPVRTMAGMSVRAAG
ncbi:hypothetical protein [Kribbella sp. CA-293567]|uniref:hypothetical protein n=1 Tax=Kribbella sp. CA-293567 TaxID=3002436 RepID=UPI0022DD5714|nr:hypothetical protein [Kribbella sp. CA-293567]WBQ05092.1 hypothetical protein OX958_34725 [Kribbella sp. CA-293567]